MPVGGWIDGAALATTHQPRTSSPASEDRQPTAAHGGLPRFGGVTPQRIPLPTLMTTRPGQGRAPRAQPEPRPRLRPPEKELIVKPARWIFGRSPADVRIETVTTMFRVPDGPHRPGDRLLPAPKTTTLCSSASAPARAGGYKAETDLRLPSADAGGKSPARGPSKRMLGPARSSAARASEAERRQCDRGRFAMDGPNQKTGELANLIEAEVDVHEPMTAGDQRTRPASRIDGQCEGSSRSRLVRCSVRRISRSNEADDLHPWHPLPEGEGVVDLRRELSRNRGRR